MMAQVVNNFIRTTLRLPAAPGDTTLSLAAGGGAFFNIPAGDWCYIVVNDSTTVEVMKYVSTGSEAGDVIGVLRGQDNTTAKAFPAGSCVAVGWNNAQITAFIQAMIDAIPPVPPPLNTGVVAISSQGFVTDTGSVFNQGIWPFGNIGLPQLISYDPGATGVITYDGVTGEIVFHANCIMSLSAAVHGLIYALDLPNPFEGSLVFTHTGGTDLIGNSINFPVTGGTGYPGEAVMNATTGPVQVTAGDQWDANLIIYALNGTFSRLQVKQMLLSATVLVLT